MLRPYQTQAIEGIRQAIRDGHRDILLHMPTGTGKCLAPGTPILMYDGRIKPVEAICVGDLLMGPDSKPRRVLSLAQGQDEMFKVTPIKGDPYTVNSAHILSLKTTGDRKTKGKVKNVPVSEYLGASNTFRHIHKGWRSGIDFNANPTLKLDPYFLGLWLGDGTSRNTSICTGDFEIKDYLKTLAEKNSLKFRAIQNSPNSELISLTVLKIQAGRGIRNNALLNGLNYYGLLQNKHIPHDYKVASRQIRLEILAGIIDTDGSYGGQCFDLTLKNERLMDDTIFIARSLGLSAYKKPVKKTCVNNGKTGDYFRCSINGELSEVPCKIARKKATPRKQKKDVLVTGLNIVSVGQGQYYGFMIDGDGLFMLGDFTVTHNTVVFSYILKHALVPSLMAVRGRQLVDQASSRLRREDTDHGVLMAGHWNSKPSSAVQICSIDTIRARQARPPAKIIIIDEAHLALSTSYAKFLALYDADTVKIWVTATPYNAQGLPCTYVVCPIRFKDAVLDGFLVPPRYYLWAGPDMAGVKTSGGDYNQVQLAKAVDKGDLIGDIVQHWKEYGEHRPTLCFAVNVAHSKHLAAKFNEAGIPAAHVDADTPEREREEQLQKHKEGGLSVITNVNIHSTGVDIPWLGCIIEARPTKSYNLYVQQLGRGTRPFEDRFSSKLDFIVLDHGGNFFRHGRIEDEPEALLAKDVAKGKKFERVTSARYCNKHFMAFEGYCPKCKEEGIENAGTEIKMEKEGRLRELKDLSPEEEYLVSLRREMNLKRKADGSKYRRGWLWFRMKERFGDETANRMVPRRVVPDWIKRRLENV